MKSIRSILILIQEECQNTLFFCNYYWVAKQQAFILSKSTVKIIIYLSCNLESFARDAKIILNNNRYQLKEITPIDQFYWSHHIELLAVFELNIEVF